MCLCCLSEWVDDARVTCVCVAFHDAWSWLCTGVACVCVAFQTGFMMCDRVSLLPFRTG